MLVLLRKTVSPKCDVCRSVVEVVQNFITTDEQQSLLTWTNTNDIPILERHDVPPSNLLPRRKKICGDGPSLFYDIQDRIKKQFNLVEPEGWEGQVFVHDPGMGTRQHTDKDSVRMTLMIQQAKEGWKLIHNGMPINTPECSLAIYNSKIPHAVGQVKNGSRVTFIYFWND